MRVSPFFQSLTRPAGLLTKFSCTDGKCSRSNFTTLAATGLERFAFRLVRALLAESGDVQRESGDVQGESGDMQGESR